MFELAPTKLWHYTLPTFGALALLAAAALARPIGKVSRITGAVLALFAALLIIGVTVYGLTVYGTSTAQTWAALTVVTTLAAAAVGAFLLLNRAPVAALVASLAFGIVAHGALAGTIRQLRPLAIAPQLEKTLEAADLHPRQGRTPGPVAITTFHEPSFVFLTGRDTELTDAGSVDKLVAAVQPFIRPAAAWVIAEELLRLAKFPGVS